MSTYLLLDFAWVWRLERGGSRTVIHRGCWDQGGWANPQAVARPVSLKETFTISEDSKYRYSP